MECGILIQALSIKLYVSDSLVHWWLNLLNLKKKYHDVPQGVFSRCYLEAESKSQD